MPQRHGKLEPIAIKIIRELIIFLKMFEEASDDFEADYETVGNFIPACLDMVKKIIHDKHWNNLLYL
jgi:hypothetical protein